MFEELKGYTKILVVGPLRSGTTIASQMIANDTGHQWVDENIFRRHDIFLALQILRLQKNVVLQAPCLSSVAHILAEYDPTNTMVVMLKRDLKDIHASQDKRGLRSQAEKLGQLKKYGIADLNTDYSQLIYATWNTQKEVIDNKMEIEYESLKDHPMWLDKSKRKNFRIKQTRLDEPAMVEK